MLGAPVQKVVVKDESLQLKCDSLEADVARLLQRVKELEQRPSDDGRVGELEKLVAELRQEQEVKINSTP